MEDKFLIIKHFTKILLQEKIDLQKDDALKLIINYFKKNIEYFFLFFKEELEDLTTNQLLSFFYLLFFFKGKIDWLMIGELELENIVYNENDIFQLTMNLEKDMKLFIMFKMNKDDSTLFFNKDEIKKIGKLRNNLILINITTFSNDKNKLIIDFFNIKDIFNLYRVDANKWKKINPQYSDMTKDAYVDEIFYKENKKRFRK